MLARPLLGGFAVALATSVASVGQETSGRPAYLDPERTGEARAADLLARMSWEEKAAQLVSIWNGKNRLLDEAGHFDRERARQELPHGIGHVARPSDKVGRGNPGVTPNLGPRETAELVNAIQRFLVEDTRLGIPALMHEEGLHGYQARDATSFPQAIALASTWDPELVEQVYRVVAREIRARGAHLVLSPVVDVGRDPRWGRIEETFGEDPHLVSELGLAAVRGFQGPRLPLEDGRVLVTLKHMTGHGQPESGTNVGPANLSERVLRETFFPPFERAIREGGAFAVMASYNEIDGVPSHANRWLLGEVLRGEWGFEGMVVSDYFAIAELHARHRVAESLERAAELALAAGIDVELPQVDAYRDLAKRAQHDPGIAARVDRAVERVLRAKMLAGLFEDPWADPDLAERITGDQAARELALRAARSAIVLLRNEGGLLPLDPGALRTVAVIGPNAAETLLGGYSDVPRRTVSLLAGIRARLGDSVEVLHAPGVGITRGRNWWADRVLLVDPEEDRRSIREAVEVARRADVVVVAVGGNEQTSREAWSEGHLGDRADLGMVGEQDELVRALVATGNPVVAVLVHGRPLAAVELSETVPAILDAWYLGQETGTALARALFGDDNPGGKLPVTVPRSVGHLPAFYDHKPTARRGYLFDTTEPLWPFGHGLSYTTFELSAPRLAAPAIPPNGRTTLEIEVRNTGTREGDEVVQLYVRDLYASVTTPVKRLIGFRRVRLAPGESRTVSLPVGPEQLRLWDLSMRRVVEPGDFELMVGPSSRTVASVTLTVTAPAAAPPG